MFAIVAHHCYVYGVHSKVPGLWTALFTTMICWHVDAFLSISGWFGIRFSWWKLLRLLGQISFYSCLSVAFLLARAKEGADWSRIRLSGGWFGDNYLALMLLVPFLNAAIERLSGEYRKAAWSAWGLFALLMTFAWLPTHGFGLLAPRGVDGHSLMLFVFVYFTMRLVRLSEFGRISKRVLMLGGVLFVAMFAFFALIDRISIFFGAGHLSGIGDVFSAYHGPHVWIAAAALVLFFVWHVRVPDWLGRVVSFCAPSMFGIYLLHETTSFGSWFYKIPQKWMADAWGLHPVWSILLSAVVAFGVCLAIDLCRRFGVWCIKRIWVARLR